MDRIPASHLALTAAGLLSLVVAFESFRAPAYDDGGGVMSYGFGATRKPDGSPVRKGDAITPDRALILLGKNVGATETALHRCIGDVPMHTYEWDAIVDLGYNVGSGAVCSSTLVKLLRHQPPDYEQVCAELLRFDRVKGKVWPGLTRRRELDYSWCMGDVP